MPQQVEKPMILEDMVQSLATSTTSLKHSLERTQDDVQKFQQETRAGINHLSTQITQLSTSINAL